MVKSGVGVLIKKIYPDASRLLIGRRTGSHAAGVLCFPGGHFEDGDGEDGIVDETFADCCERESEEEAGMIVKAVAFDPPGREEIFCTYLNLGTVEEPKRYTTPYYLANYVSGGTFDGYKVKPGEPKKFIGWWEFITLDELVERLKTESPEVKAWIPIESILHYRAELGL